ncbi:MAG: hypothetical protein LBK23_06640 [Oscillospiraceae bacterium]|jgi:hypothetical protein|nr:hypothetical protein [Oscillospiraceae bacterium]
MSNKAPLTLEKLYIAAKEFCYTASQKDYPELIGITDGKAVGTFVEHRLKHYLSNRFLVKLGNSASGIDLPAPEINTDIKVIRIVSRNPLVRTKIHAKRFSGLVIICLCLFMKRKIWMGPVSWISLIAHLFQKNVLPILQPQNGLLKC